MTLNEYARIEALVDRARRRGRLGEVLLAIESGDGSRRFVSGAPERPYFIASATKLYVTALLARLRQRGAIDWDRPFAAYLPDLDLAGLHVLDGVDRTGAITVRQLMAHTSGLPDYFEGRRGDGPSTFARALRADFAWSLGDVIAWSRDRQRPHFVPGAPGRALYSDTNYQLLGAIIERGCGMSFAEAVEREIAGPLGLAGTWCFALSTLQRYGEIAPMRDGRSPLRIPQAMASVGADGGIVSTLADSIRFLRAFFGAELFPAAILAELQQDWRRIFFPLEYGTGIMRFRVPWFFSPFRRIPAVVGHSGASGALMFWCPDRDLYIAGTVNQIRSRSASYQLMIRALTLWPRGRA